MTRYLYAVSDITLLRQDERFRYSFKKLALPNTILDAEGIEGKEFSSERGQRAGGAAAPASVVEKLLA